MGAPIQMNTSLFGQPVYKGGFWRLPKVQLSHGFVVITVCNLRTVRWFWRLSVFAFVHFNAGNSFQTAKNKTSCQPGMPVLAVSTVHNVLLPWIWQATMFCFGGFDGPRCFSWAVLAVRMCFVFTVLRVRCISLWRFWCSCFFTFPILWSSSQHEACSGGLSFWCPFAFSAFWSQTLDRIFSMRICGYRIGQWAKSSQN